MKRTRLATNLLLTTSAMFLALQGCNSGSTLQQPPASTDEETGGSATGGVVGVSTTGGANSNMGGSNSNTGGTSSNSNTGGTSSNSNTGGTSSNSNTGGASRTGGTTSVSPTGGTNAVSPTGGAPSTPTGGAASTPTGGATSASTGSGNTVTFASGKGVGAMTGYGFVAMGATDTVSSPTCGTAAITATTPCTTSTTWSSTTALCVTGNVPIVDAPTYASWGLSVGLNATDPAGSGIGQSFTSITINVTGSPTTNLRAVVHRKGDTDAVSYCAALTPGTAIALTSFQTDCYNNTTATGPKITATDIPNIDKVSVQVSAGTTAITVTNLCITGITFS